MGDSLLDVVKCNLDENNWYYKGEGNANVIIAMRNECTILRIPKFNKNECEINCEENDTYQKKDLAATSSLEINDNRTSNKALGKSSTYSSTKYRRTESIGSLDLVESSYGIVENSLDLVEMMNSRNDILKRLSFYHSVIYPLFTKHYFKIPTLGVIDHKHFDILNKGLENIRPHNRKHKIIKPGYVTVCKDLTFLQTDQIELLVLPDDKKSKQREFLSNFENQCLQIKYDELLFKIKNEIQGNEPEGNIQHDTFCVEIKPKQGYRCKNDTQFQQCPFCLNQYLKLEKCSVNVPSQYCPLDLFSGDLVRMIKSIKALFQTPQNNLRIFVNGGLKYGDEYGGSIESFLDMFYADTSNTMRTLEDRLDELAVLICKMLTHEPEFKQTNTSKVYESIVKNDELEKVLKSSIEKIAESSVNETLTNTCISDILNMPKRLDIDEVSKLNKLLINSSNCNFEHKQLPKNCILNKILDIQKLDIHGADFVYFYYKNNADSIDIIGEKGKEEEETISNQSKSLHNFGDYSKITESRINNLHKVLDKSENLNDDAEASTEKSASRSDKTLAKCDVYDIKGHKDSDIKGHKDRDIKGHKDSDIKGHKDSDIKGHNVIRSERKSNEIQDNIRDEYSYVKDLSVQDLDKLDPIERYLLSTMAKDCSILITFQKYNGLHNSYSEISHGQIYIFNVNVVDVDAKPISCIEKHKIRDTQIIKAAINVLENPQSSYQEERV